MAGRVYLVGAGPGDPELLTVKAYKLIKNADVILYDRLINPEILEIAKPDCKLVYVGKEDGKHLKTQEEINNLLLFYAKQYETVVRLKGGDPFVFGRGGEEAIFLKKHKIPFEIVPGITSAVSVPAYAGIPITHRGLASSFAVITGHETPEKAKSSINWESLKDIDTLVFLMCVNNRKYIAKKLIEIGRNPKEPVAFIHRGTTSSQSVVETTLEKIVASNLSIKPPSVMVVGKVVRLRNLIDWFKPEVLLKLQEEIA
ncbi:MAG: uroporphyrinogen-III C-methyltransferase [Aquificae bacterium]|nr:uroporphyrinogen-III C-methyltransferase [Aquificota bacterium]